MSKEKGLDIENMLDEAFGDDEIIEDDDDD